MNHVRKKVNYAYAQNERYTGRGVTVVAMDTGIYPHPDFENRIKYFKDFVNNRAALYDDNSHGTHVSGIIAGAGAMSDRKYMGIAPGCNIIMLKILDEHGNGDTSAVLEAVDWIIKNKDKYNIRIMNISVGTLPKTGSEEKSTILDAVEYVWDNEIAVIAAAGNNGPNGYTITTPGISRKVITVGSSDDGQQDAFGKVKVNYSGRGPTINSCIIKPDVIAPGLNITSCNSMRTRSSRPYSVKSGTSMSTPVVSGAIALLVEKYPDMCNRDIKLRLKDCAVDMGLPKNRQGWGRIDIERLLKK